MKKKKQRKPKQFNEQAATAAYTAVANLRDLFNRGFAQELAEFGLSQKTIKRIAQEI